MDNQNLNNYIKSVINISFLTNKYINDTEPWKLKKVDKNKMNNIFLNIYYTFFISNSIFWGKPEIC